jgi:hypothetical protein
LALLWTCPELADLQGWLLSRSNEETFHLGCGFGNPEQASSGRNRLLRGHMWSSCNGMFGQDKSLVQRAGVNLAGALNVFRHIRKNAKKLRSAFDIFAQSLILAAYPSYYVVVWVAPEWPLGRIWERMD